MSAYLLDIQAAALQKGLSFTKTDLQARYDQYLSYLPGEFPVGRGGEIDPGEVYKYSKSGLVKFVQKEMGSKIPPDVISYIASAGGGRGVNLKVPELATLTEALSQMGGTAVLERSKEIFQGANFSVPEGIEGIGMVTVDALMSGKPIGSTIGKALGTGVGTMAGAKIGAAMGTVIPGIGNIVGAAIGAMVSVMFRGMFNQRPPPPPRPISPQQIRNAMAAQVEQQRFDSLNVIRDNAVATCKAQEEMYWNGLDEAIYTFSKNWSDKEIEMGFKFPLRWFDDTQGPAFYANPSNLSRIGANWAIVYKSKSIDLNSMPGVFADTRESADYYTYLMGDNILTNCKLSTMGCPYPSMHAVTNYPTGKFGAGGKYATFAGMQAARAFAARDILWVPQSMRLNCERYLPYPTYENFTSEAGAAAYGKLIDGMSDDITTKNLRFSIGMQQLNADLVRTATIYQTYLNSLVGSALYGKSFKASQIDAGFGKVETYNNRFNNAALAAGLGVLGFSLWRSFK